MGEEGVGGVDTVMMKDGGGDAWAKSGVNL